MASMTRTVCVQSGVVCQVSANPGEHLRQGSARTISPKATTPSSAKLKGVNFIGKAQEKRRSGARRSVITNQAAKAILAGAGNGHGQSLFGGASVPRLFGFPKERMIYANDWSLIAAI